MFIASLLTIMAIGGFPSFVEDMKVSSQSKSTMKMFMINLT